MLNSASTALEYILRRERSLVAETNAFRSMKHNAHLCPTIQRQVETVLNAFGRFEPIVYDTQGPGDHGVDIVVRCERERRDADGEPQVIGLQVKSYDDLKSKNLLRDLKAQHDDARRKVRGLKDYFIVLCTDEQAHKDLIRVIEAEFRSAPSTFVIEPTFAYRFLTMAPRRIEGLITRAVQAEDEVFRRALETADVGRMSAGILAVYAATQALAGRLDLEVGDLLHDPILGQSYADLRRAIEREHQLALERSRELEGSMSEDEGESAYENVIDDDDDGDDVGQLRELLVEDVTDVDLLGIDLEFLDGRVLDMDPTAATARVRLEELMPIIALLADALVRYELAPADLLPFGLNALGLLET